MKVILIKDKVISGSVWLAGSEVDLPAEEAKALIDAEEATPSHASPKSDDGKKKAAKE